MKKIIQILFVALAAMLSTIQPTEAANVPSSFLNLGYKQPYARHTINSIAPDLSNVEFTDGSKWHIPSACRPYTVSNWRPGDTLLVTQNTSYFTSPYYLLQNLTTASYAYADLTLWPIRNNPNTHWIDAINYTTGQLILEDGTMWDISSSDAAILHKWLVGDLIIIGSNYNQYWSNYKNILINTNSNLNEYVRSKLN